MLARNALQIFLVLPLVFAQKYTFEWGFSPNPDPSLTECGSVSIAIYKTGAAAPVPPFVLLSYEAGGPTHNTLLVGTDNSKLQWTVPHSAGKQLIIQVADALGNSGGFGNKLYNVGAGSSSDCHSNDSPSVKMTATTTSLNTCDPLTLEFDGGTKPYTITLVSLNSTAPVNKTMGSNDNEYIYINKLLTSPMLAAAHDASGQYSLNTGLITVGGGGDNSCPGKSDISRVRSTGSHSNTAAIAGGATVGVVVLIGLSAVALYFMRRRKHREEQSGARMSMDVSQYGDDSFAAKPQHSQMSDYGVNQFLHDPHSLSSQGTPSAHLQYAPPDRSTYFDSSSSRGNSTYGSQPFYPQQSSSHAGEMPNSVVQPYPPSPGSPGQFGQSQMQRPASHMLTPPASVAYASNANLRYSQISEEASSSSGPDTKRPTNARKGSHPLMRLTNLHPHEAEDGESEAAYRDPGGSEYNAYVEQLQRKELEKIGQRPFQTEPQVVQHRDAGPVVEVPPAYGDRSVS